MMVSECRNHVRGGSPSGSLSPLLEANVHSMILAAYLETLPRASRLGEGNASTGDAAREEEEKAFATGRVRVNPYSVAPISNRRAAQTTYTESPRRPLQHKFRNDMR